MSTAFGRRGAPQPTMSIGEVLALLRPEFPDVTISKIRFLEEQGLVEPDRTPAGYRKFTHDDVERLRYVLAVQRDHYLPLRVIKEHLDALDRGLDPPALPGGAPRVPRLVGDTASFGPERFERGPDLRLSRSELLDAAPVDDDLLTALESYALVSPVPGTATFDAEAVTVCRAAAELARFGIEPRHLRLFRTAADREAGLVDQVVAPLRRQRGPEAAGRAEEAEREVAALCLRLHAALVKTALDRSDL
ncbi:MAG TPA: MerR family transcriptional regulator [Kineosporiaceae bacterium]|nr:MerR family transcriptional regulator [Kineosporiaceae bacterium]